MIHIFEFWAIDEHGQKHNESVKTKYSRASKIKKIISRKFKLNIETCKDFGMRETTQH